MASRSQNRRQPLLLTLRSPLSERFGDAFFRALPAGPGVYFFRDAAGELLYIGQSGSLRHRVGSYRHVDPERNPRRLLRLIHRVRAIEWRDCASAAEAIALEARLLLEHRPPFNRAGVWPAAVWWMRLRREEGQLAFELHRAANSPADQLPESAAEPWRWISDLERESRPDLDSGLSAEWHGPLSARQGRAFPALARCLHLAMHGNAGHWEFPIGLLQNRGLRRHVWPLRPGAGSVAGIEETLTLFSGFLRQPCGLFPDRIQALLSAAGVVCTPALRSFWEEQLEEIRTLVPQTENPPEAGREEASTELPRAE